MDINKSHWVADGESVRLTMPLSKVDKENRLVSGFATLDNHDSQGDIVTSEASKSAFSRFRGNIREMHQPIAAGRIVDFKEDQFYDKDSDKFYTGVYVTAYISKGAQDTWEKVLDKTLTGFSIGGSIKDSDTEWSKDADSAVRIVKDYDLIELSLVDNPANQLANVFSITKSAEGSIIKGMVAEVELENVFYCKTDGIAKSSKDDSLTCTNCGRGMENIGWFEREGNHAEKVRDVVNKFLDSETNDAAEAPDKNEGGDHNVTDKNEETQPVGNEEVNADTTDAETDAAESGEGKEVEGDANPAEAEGAADVSEENTDEPNFEKMFSDLSDKVNEALESNSEKTNEVVTKVKDDLDALTKSLDTKTSELEKSLEAKFTEFGERLDAIKEENKAVTKRLEAFENGTAVRKSGDKDAPATDGNDEEESLFKGAFLNLKGLQ